MGDFNASDSNGFCTYLNRFCKENGFILSDKQWLPSSTLTYISEAHGSVSWLDHFLTSTNVNQYVRYLYCMILFPQITNQWLYI